MRKAIVLATAVVFGGQQIAPALAGPALLFDASTGRVLYSEDLDHAWFPASLTKIMTAYLVFEALKAGRITLETKLRVSENAIAQPPSKVGLPVGAEMTIDLALRALIVKSANDVAVMIAEGVAGNEEAFVKLMNDTAKRLGMKRTNFVNPHGLPAPEQVTTARDLALLSHAVLRDFPDRAHLWAEPEVRIGRRRLGSHNGLLKTLDGADGIKTGFICDSGYNVVASATRDGRRLVAVVLGEPSGAERNLRAASLLEHGFQTYDWKQLFNTATISSIPPAPEAKAAQSIRQAVLKFECSGRGRSVARKRVGKRVARTPGAVQGDVGAAGRAVAPGPRAPGQRAAPRPPGPAQAAPPAKAP